MMEQKDRIPKKRVLLLVGLGVIVLCAIILVICLFSGGNDRTEPEEATEPSSDSISSIDLSEGLSYEEDDDVVIVVPATRNPTEGETTEQGNVESGNIVPSTSDQKSGQNGGTTGNSGSGTADVASEDGMFSFEDGDGTASTGTNIPAPTESGTVTPPSTQPSESTGNSSNSGNADDGGFSFED